MRLVSWNVNSIRARLPRLLELLEAHAPDVVCLQELKCADEGLPRLDLEAAGYSAVAAHCGGRWAGVAILVRHGFEVSDVRSGLSGEARPDEARWVEANVGGLRVASAYVPNGQSVGSPQFDDKLAFLDAMVMRQERPDPPAVVAGDLNVARSDADVWDPSAFVGATHVTPEERSRLEELLSAGMIDAYRRLHATSAEFTWWDYRAGAFHRGMGMRIDYLLMAEPLADRLRTCGIDRAFRKGPKPSDHAPLLADLD